VQSSTRGALVAAGITAFLLPLAAAARPTIAWQSPAAGGTLTGNVQGPPLCVVTGSDIERVMFYINGTWTNTDGNLSNGLGCWIDTTKYKDGAYRLEAVAYNAKGQTARASRDIVVSNPPSISWQTPAEGGALSGNVQGPPHCIVTGSNVARVMFYINGVWTNTDGNLDNGLGCWIDTTKYADGAYTLKAVAYSAAGLTAEASRGIVIRNGVANTPPAVSLSAPAAGATLSGTVACEAAAADADGTVARVDFFLDGAALGSDAAAPYQCAIDTTRFANGDHVLMAAATDDKGLAASTQRTVRFDNAREPAPAPLAIDAADILGQGQAGVPFAEQSGYTGQILGTYPYVTSIPESGIHGTVLASGETLRLGKEADPTDSTRKALAFQLAPTDPLTSKSRRAEISFPPNVEMGKVYWVALSVYVYDWGALPGTDAALFGTQLHSGDNSLGLSPSFGIYTSGGTQFRIESRYSTSATPSQASTITTRHGYRDIPFGRWVDFVFRFKQSIDGNGFLQVWQDGEPIVDHQGSLGFNTPGYRDYIKFGYYNWSSFATSRKVLLRSPMIVLDPSGSKYSAEDLRAHVRSR
jgi:hypothetical protein